MTDTEFYRRKPGNKIRYIGGGFDMIIICLPNKEQEIIETFDKHENEHKVGDIVDMCSVTRMTYIDESLPNTFIAKNGKEISFNVRKTC